MNEVTAAEPQAEVGGVQVSLQSVYLKDCSYESPNGPRLPSNQPWEPKFQLNMNTSTEEFSPEAREVLLTITVEDGQTMQMSITGSTKFIRDGKPAKAADFHSDDAVTVDASRDAHFTLIAVRVEAVKPPAKKPDQN